MKARSGSRASRRRRLPVAFAAATLAAGLATAASPSLADTAAEPATPRAFVEPRLLDELRTDDAVDFWVYLRERPSLRAAAAIEDRAEQGWYVYEQLTRTAQSSQDDLVELLDAEGTDHESFWIANTVHVTGGRGIVDRIAALPEVARITADRSYVLPEPAPARAENLVDGVEWNVDRIRAPQVWEQLDVTGENVVVGSIDSGVQYDHPALVNQYRGNLGGGEFDHDYNWWDPSNVCASPSLAPCDNSGHGTHVTGTMIGDDGAGNRIGVAPGATWIAAKGCESSTCSQAALLSSGQFMLAPTDLAGENPNPELRPHVLNNSWGGGATTDPWYQPTVRAWIAAGIFPQFANGNTNGAAPCGSSSNPGNLPESYAAGAFDIDGVVAPFSNRGPSAFGAGDLIKPDIAAPGVAVRSSVPGDGYASNSGTSMASPHVAGVVALMWSASPDLVRDVASTRELLDQTAIDVSELTCGGTAGDNNVWGEGRLDAFAAVEQSPRGPTGSLTGTVTDAATGDPVSGALVTVTGAVERRRSIGDDGGYVINSLPVGDYEVAASAFGYEPVEATATVTEGSTTVLDLTLAAPDGPRLSLSKEVLDLGEVAAGTSSGAATLTLSSVGSDPVAVRDVSAPDGGFTAVGGTCAATPFTLDRLDSCTLEYRYRPAIEGPGESTVTVSADDPDSPHRVTLRGTGVSMVGAALWTARHDGPGDDSDVAHAVATSPDGATTFVTGRNGGADTLTDYVTVAYDTDSGEQLWAARYDGPASKTDEAWDLGVSPDGSRVFVTGGSATGSFSSDADYATIAYDAGSGDRLWLARYNGPGDNEDVAQALGVTPDGTTVLVTGGSQTTSRFTSTDYTTIAYDAASGEQRWLARYNGPGDNRDVARAIQLSPDGATAFVAGASPSAGFLTDDYATVAYDTVTGEQRWAARYDGPGNRVDGAEAVDVSSDGSQVFVTGGSAGSDSGSDYATVAYAAGTGAQAWVARYDAPTGGHDTAADVVVGPGGSRVYVTGGSGGDYATLGYDAATGGEVWAARYDGPVGGPDTAAAVEVSPDGSRVFVTGNSVGVSFDAVTVAYHADSGAREWLARYNGPGEDGDAGTALSVTPDGRRLLVTGQSVGIGSGADYMTVAYGAAPPEIVLGADGRRVRGRHVVDLSWHGPTAAELDVYRDDIQVATVRNDGFHIDVIDARGPGRYRYRLCNSASAHCSAPRTVWFGGPPA